MYCGFCEKPTTTKKHFSWKAFIVLLIIPPILGGIIYLVYYFRVATPSCITCKKSHMLLSSEAEFREMMELKHGKPANKEQRKSSSAGAKPAKPRRSTQVKER